MAITTITQQMSKPQIAQYFRYMGYTATIVKTGIIISYRDEDVLKDQILPMIVAPMPNTIKKIIQLWHEDDDSFDRVKLLIAD